MEMKPFSETKNWKKVYEIAKELLKENKINAIEFIHHKVWEKNPEKIYRFFSPQNEEQLKELFTNIIDTDFKKFSLYNISLIEHPEKPIVLIVVCYK